MHMSVCIVNVEWNKFDLRNCGDPPVLEAALKTQLCHLGSESALAKVSAQHLCAVE